MATSTTQNLSNLIINRVTSPEVFEEMLQTPNTIQPNEFYLVEGEETVVDWDDIQNKPNSFTPPTAADDTLGGIKTNYSASGKNYAIKVDSNGNAYVNVPWTDNNTTSFTITANATDGLWDLTGTSGTNAVTYALAPYSSKKTSASFYTGTTNPTLTTRLNYDGYLYATKLYSGGSEVLTSHQSLDNYKTKQTAITDSTGTSETSTATRFVYSVSQNANGEISVKTRPLPTYNNYSLPLAASGTRGGIQIGYSESGNNYAVKLSSEKAYVTVPLDTKAPLDSPVLTGTPRAPTAEAGTNSTQIATTEFVTRAVSQGFVANDAMVFKGLIGSNQTITQLPTSGYNAGWTYRVADAGTFAGEYCEVGDLLIAINDGPASGSSVIGADWGKVEHNIDGAVFRGAGASNSSVGSSTQPVYVNASGVVTAITGAIANDTTGNAATATVASKLSNTSKIGDTNKPVYFKADGTPAAINYTISESVPSNAVFTDTTYIFNTTAQTNKIQYKATGASSWTDVPITVSITNNITGSGTSGSLAKFNGTNTITTGPSFSNAISSQDQTTKFLREDGTWSAPTYTTSTVAAQIIRW